MIFVFSYLFNFLYQIVSKSKESSFEYLRLRGGAPIPMDPKLRISISKKHELNIIVNILR